jgi:transcriptional repressor NrdR
VTCGHRFTTYERAALTIFVRKRSGAVEPFEPFKVRRGMEHALADRPGSEGAIDQAVAVVEAAGAAQGGEISADEIGRIVLESLRQVDEVSYLRFASVYKEFQGARDFEREMAALEEEG